MIGAVMLSNGRVLDDLNLDYDDFYRPAMAGLYRLLEGMRRRGVGIDPVTVWAEVTASKAPELRGLEPGMLHEWLASTSTAANAEHYAAIIAEEATRRRLRVAGHAVAEAADMPGDVATAVDKARGIVDAAAKIRVESVRSFGETIDETLSGFETAVSYQPTPWKDMNSLIGGLAAGRFYVFGARPGVGKSVAALQLAISLLERGAVAFVSLEMSNAEVQTRAISYDLKINLSHLEKHQLSEADWRKIGQRRELWAETPLFVSDETGMTISKIRQFARSVSRRRPLAGIVVDYLQLLASPKGDRSRQEFVSDCSRELKIMAREFGVPVVALSQLNRDSQRREDKRPELSDLRESGSLEQDADVVVLLHRELLKPERGNDIGLMVAKNRHGPTGALTMSFFGHFSEIRDKVPDFSQDQLPPGTGGNHYMDRIGNDD